MKTAMYCFIFFCAALFTARTTAAQAYDCAAQSEVPQAECEALVALYNATGGDNWTNKTNWLTGTVNTWHGVVVNGGYVFQIFLASNNLVGTLPPELGNLPTLQLLHLVNNQLSGEIPAALGNATALTELNLFNNQLSGAIPPELGNLTSLTRLSLFANQLSGEIPGTLANLSNLEALSLNSNQLSGTIPANLSQLTRLTELSLADNQFAGPLPSVLFDITSLTSLDLAQNQFSGSLPSNIAQLASLAFLRLDNNQLDGPLPPALGTLTNLKRLQLHSNQFSGLIPAELGVLTNLITLLLEDNQLTGPLPSELGALSALERLFLGENPLEGTLPNSLTSLTNITFFDISGTQLCAPGEAGFQTWLQGIQTVHPNPVPTCTPTATEDTETIAATYTFLQNYPNPFNPSTTIRYGVPATGPVRLAVYDLLGREVVVLMEGIQSAGWHEVAFEAGDLPAGVYLYRLTAGNNTYVRTLTLLK